MTFNSRSAQLKGGCDEVVMQIPMSNMYNITIARTAKEQITRMMSVGV
jgi:hypothetical protein